MKAEDLRLRGETRQSPQPPPQQCHGQAMLQPSPRGCAVASSPLNTWEGGDPHPRYLPLLTRLLHPVNSQEQIAGTSSNPQTFPR